MHKKTDDEPGALHEANALRTYSSKTLPAGFYEPAEHAANRRGTVLGRSRSFRSGRTSGTEDRATIRLPPPTAYPNIEPCNDKPLVIPARKG
jgi:hypothetical protein